MGTFGDMLFNLTGQVDPRRRLATALAGAGQPDQSRLNLVGSVNPNDAAAGGTPVQLAGAVQDQTQNPPAPAPVPAAPPQPQAYTSAPDFSKMYLDLLNRQEASDAIDRGMGLLFAGFAQPQDRAGMVNAMSAGSGRAGNEMTQLLAGVEATQKIQGRQQLLMMAPQLAKQLNMPVEQVIASINSGAMDNIIQEQQKATILQSSPLYKAQVGSEQAQVNLRNSQIEEQRALANLHNAEIAGVPAKIAEAQAAADKAKADADKARAEIGAIPSQIEQRQAETEKAKAETANIPLTPDIKNYNQYVTQFQADPSNAGKKPLSFLEFQQQGGGGGGGVKLFGQTHIQLKRDDQGNVARNPDGSPQFDVVQLTDRPGVPPVVQPGLQPKITKTDTDTETRYSVMTDAGPQVIDVVPKNVQEGARQRAVGTEQGKAQAEARTGLESKLGVIDDQIKIISDAINDPNLASRVGPILQNPLRLLPPTSEADIATESRLRQAQGLNIAQIASTLREAGISRPALQEVMTAASSVNRLQFTNLSAKDYRAAGQEAIDRLRRAMAVAYDSAGVKRPDSLKDVNLETGAAPAATIESTIKPPATRKGRYDPQQKKIIYD